MCEVRYKDKSLHLPDANYVLADIREAFGQPTGVLRFAGTEILAVAMPHEPITRLDVMYDLHVPGEDDDDMDGGQDDEGKGLGKPDSDLEDATAALRQLVAMGGSSLLDVLSMPAAGDDYRPVSGVASTRSVYGPTTYSPFRSDACGVIALSREVRWAQSPPYVAPIESYVLLDPSSLPSNEAPASLPSWVAPQSSADADALLRELKAVAVVLDARFALSTADVKGELLDVKPSLS